MALSSKHDYEGFASLYDDFKSDDDYPLFYSILKNRFLEPAAFSLQDAHVWEVGCGTGTFSQLFKNDGAHVFGTDVSPDMVAEAQRKHPGIDFFVSDVSKETVNLDHGRCNLVAALDDVVNCLKGTSEIENGLSNINRALRPGGLFLFDAVSKHAFVNYMGTVSHRVKGDSHFLTWPLFPLTASYQGPFSMACCSVTLDPKSDRWIKSESVFTEYWHSERTIDRALQDAGFSIVAKRGLTQEGEILDSVHSHAEHINKVIYLCRKEAKNEHH